MSFNSKTDYFVENGDCAI